HQHAPPVPVLVPSYTRAHSVTHTLSLHVPLPLCFSPLLAGDTFVAAKPSRTMEPTISFQSPSRGGTFVASTHAYGGQPPRQFQSPSRGGAFRGVTVRTREQAPLRNF